MATITKSIGSASRDYTTIAAWAADLDNGAIYSSGDDAIGELYADSVFSVSTTTTINLGGTVGLSSITLRANAGSPHGGLATAGAIVRLSAGVRAFLLQGTVPITLEGFVIDCNGLGASSTGAVIGMGSSATKIVRRMVIKGWLLSSNTSTGRDLISNASGSYSLLDSIIYGCQLTNTGTGGLTVAADGGFSGHVIRNNTIYGIVRNSGSGPVTGIGMAGSGDEVRNNLVCSVGGTTSGIKRCFTFGTTTTSNNISDDASADDGGGSGHVISVTTANQFVSISGGAEDLHLKAGSDAIGAGTTLSGNGVEVDIDGVTRTGTWDVGADQYAASGTTYNLTVTLEHGAGFAPNQARTMSGGVSLAGGAAQGSGGGRDAAHSAQMLAQAVAAATGGLSYTAVQSLLASADATATGSTSLMALATCDARAALLAALALTRSASTTLAAGALETQAAQIAADRTLALVVAAGLGQAVARDALVIALLQASGLLTASAAIDGAPADIVEVLSFSTQSVAVASTLVTWSGLAALQAAGTLSPGSVLVATVVQALASGAALNLQALGRQVDELVALVLAARVTTSATQQAVATVLALGIQADLQRTAIGVFTRLTGLGVAADVARSTALATLASVSLSTRAILDYASSLGVEPSILALGLVAERLRTATVSAETLRVMGVAESVTPLGL